MKKIILLVDDDKSERELFREAIRSTDPEIIYYAANDGKQALTLLENNIDYLPQVIFLDINMAVMSGWECLKALKSDERFKNIPVIMYSTSNHQRDINIALDFGAMCFCVKPESYKVLLKIISLVANNLNGNLAEALKQSDIESLHFTKA